MDFAERQKAVEQAEESIERATSSRGETAAFVIFGLLLAVVVGTVIIFGLQKSKEAKISSLSGQIQSEVRDQLATLSKEQKEITTVLGQLDALSTALSSRVKQSLLFNDLKAHQLKKSRWSQVSIENKVVTITGSADDFGSVAKAVAALRGMKAVESIKLASANLNQDTQKVEYSLSITLNTKQYEYAPANAKPTASASPSGS